MRQWYTARDLLGVANETVIPESARFDDTVLDHPAHQRAHPNRSPNALPGQMRATRPANSRDSPSSNVVNEPRWLSTHQHLSPGDVT